MRKWLKNLDQILRGEATRVDTIRTGTLPIEAGGLFVLVLLLGAVYGLCMGSFSVFREEGRNWMQLVASAIKVPALFLLTLLVTLPSLYVFNTLVGSRLNFTALLRLLIAAIAVNLTVLASLGPIVAFFSASTTSYSFMVLLNVVMFVVAGVLGLMFLLQTLHRLSIGPEVTAAPAPEAISPSATESALDKPQGYVLGKHVKAVFRVWMIVFALVGAQMGWVLRPFLGNPGQPFSWFRTRESNFFEAVWQHFLNLFR